MQQKASKLHLLITAMGIRKREYSTQQEIIEGCIKREPPAQRKLYEVYAPKMLTLATRYAGDRERAKDILHDGFITLFNKIDSYSGIGSFEGWVRRIFVNTALMSLRKADVLRNTEEINNAVGEISDNPGPVEMMSSKELMELIASMPDGFRLVFNMYAIEGYNHQEIAKELNISEGSSRSQLSRARMWLQERIRRQNEGE
jgi:RNA polymerase sigma-70 factor (ECF subfamily)